MPVREHPIALSGSGGLLNGLPLDLALVGRLRSTYELVRASDRRFAELFYDKLFAAAPELRPLFRSDLATQAGKLMASLDVVVRNLEKPGENAAMLAALGKRHAAYGAKPEHYELVVKLLIESMQELLGPHADQRRLEEWRTALRLISSRMIAASVESPAAL